MAFVLSSRPHRSGIAAAQDPEQEPGFRIVREAKCQV
jgi:hypothetical protein